MDRLLHRTRKTRALDSPTSAEARLFAQTLLGKRLPDPTVAMQRASAERERLEWLASISERHAKQLRVLELTEADTGRDHARLEWLAQFSEAHARKLLDLLRQEVDLRKTQNGAEESFDASAALEGWDPGRHPRRGGAPNAGWFASTGGGGDSGGASSPRFVPSHADLNRPSQSSVQLAAFSGGASSTWPAMGSASPWLPQVGSGAATSAGVATSIGAGGFLGALRNGSIAGYWARVPGVKAMPEIWVYELEKRVRAGTLTREDARGIFTTAVLGAEAQGFKPSGDRFSLVHKSAVDFLGKAEAVYFARKKEKGWAVQPGGYQQSEGRVFPTKHNSGLDGYALRTEQEDLFKRGFAKGLDPGYLRGQVSVTGERRLTDPDRLENPELEAALQRAIEQSKKSTK